LVAEAGDKRKRAKGKSKKAKVKSERFYLKSGFRLTFTFCLLPFIARRAMHCRRK
jgi:hypothetical protein